MIHRDWNVYEPKYQFNSQRSIRVFNKNTHGKIIKIVDIQDTRFHRINTITLKMWIFLLTISYFISKIINSFLNYSSFHFRMVSQSSLCLSLSVSLRFKPFKLTKHISFSVSNAVSNPFRTMYRGTGHGEWRNPRWRYIGQFYVRSQSWPETCQVSEQWYREMLGCSTVSRPFWFSAIVSPFVECVRHPPSLIAINRYERSRNTEIRTSFRSLPVINEKVVGLLFIVFAFALIIVQSNRYYRWNYTISSLNVSMFRRFINL